MSCEGDRLLDELDHLPAEPLKRGLNYSHSAMIDAILANPWIHQNQLAAMFGYSASWISTIMATDAFQAKLAERKDALVDPRLRATIEEQVKGLFGRSMEILREKLAVPAANVPDQLAIQTFSQSARALGYGARPEPKVEVNITNQIETHADNLVQLLRREKAKVEEEPIDAEATRVG
jgi:hypothetical protein